MQFVVPQKPIRIRAVRLLHTDRLIDITMVIVPPHTLASSHDARPVEVRRRIVVNVRDETVRVENRKVRARVSFRDQHFKGRLVPEHAVHRRRVLVHRLGDLRVVGRLVGPVLVCPDAVQGVVGVQGRQVQGRRVHQDEHAAPRGVEFVKDVVHARSVVRQHFAPHMAVGHERPDAEVVGADPQRIDGRGSGQAG